MLTRPRYDQIAALVLIVAVGLGVIFLIDINPNILRARVGAILPGISVAWLLVVLLGLIASAGADVLARGVPAIQQRDLPGVTLGNKRFELAPAFWLLPFFSVVTPFAFFRLFNVGLQGIALVLALLAACGLLVAVLVGQHYALLNMRSISTQARLGLHLITYILAFGNFSVVLFAQYRMLVTAPLIALISTLLCIAVLHWYTSASIVVAAMVGVLSGQAAWAVSYWGTSFLLGAAVLLLLFYVSTSLLQQFYSAQGLRRHIVLEYSLLGGGLLAVLIVAVSR